MDQRKFKLSMVKFILLITIIVGSFFVAVRYAENIDITPNYKVEMVLDGNDYKLNLNHTKDYGNTVLEHPNETIISDTTSKLIEEHGYSQNNADHIKENILITEFKLEEITKNKKDILFATFVINIVVMAIAMPIIEKLDAHEDYKNRLRAEIV